MSTYPSIENAERLPPAVADALESLCAQLEGLFRTIGVRPDGSIQLDPAAALESGPFSTPALALTGRVTATGVITPPALTGATGAYFPTGFDDALVLRLSSTNPVTINGLGYFAVNRQVAGAIKILANVGAFALTLPHENGGAPAWTRLTCPNAADWVMQPGEVRTVWYDIVTGRWLVLDGQTISASTSLILTSLTVDDLVVTKTIACSGVITPSVITGPVDDYNPSGFDAAYLVRLESDANRRITGFEHQAAGQRRLLWNIGSNPLTLGHNDGSSSGANRVRLPLGDDWVLQSNAAIEIVYDGDQSCWRPGGATFAARAGASDSISLLHANGSSHYDIDIDNGIITSITFFP